MSKVILEIEGQGEKDYYTMQEGDVLELVLTNRLDTLTSAVTKTVRVHKVVSGKKARRLALESTS